MNRRQRVRLLIGLLVLWAMTALGVYGFSREPQRMPLVNVSGSTGTPPEGRGGTSSPELRVHVKLFEASRSARAQEFTPPRNVFVSPGESDAFPAVEPSANEAFVAVDSMPADASVATDPVETGSPLRYLGFVGIGDSKYKRAVAVLAEGADLHMIREGDPLDPYRRVRRVTPEVVTLFDQRSQQELRLPLVELTPGTMPTS